MPMKYNSSRSFLPVSKNKPPLDLDPLSIFIGNPSTINTAQYFKIKNRDKSANINSMETS